MLFQVAPDPPGPFPLRLSIQNNKEFVSRELPDPPGRFSLHVPIKDNKECFLPGLRILQVHFPNNSVFKTLRTFIFDIYILTVCGLRCRRPDSLVNLGFLCSAPWGVLTCMEA
jgi:hypothetical protein